MPSPRRVRLLALAAFLTLVFLFYSGRFGSDSSNAPGFYHKTKQAMDGSSVSQEILDSTTGQKAGEIPAAKIEEEDRQATLRMQERLKAAEIQAKEKANEKGGLRPDPPKKVVGIGNSAKGQAKDESLADEETDTKESSDKAPKADEKEEKALEKDSTTEKKKTTTKKKASVQTDLDAILKNAPIVIFSKTYCPFSKRAKVLLLEKYMITPEPYVMELDENPMGPSIQDQLLAKTERRTVPNIMINGVSIGGADDIADLDKQGKLVKKILELGKNGIDMVERPA